MVNTVSVSLENAAAELGVTPLAVKRLIARNRLKATVVGNGTENKAVGRREPGMRILPDNLAAYIGQGANDLTMPKTAGPWFEDRDVTSSLAFRSAVIEAAEPQKLSNEEATRIAAQQPDRQRFERQLTITPAIREVINRAVPAGPSAPNVAAESSRFSAWKQAYFANLLRRHVYNNLKPQAGMPVSTKPALERLYSSPDEYRRVTMAAVVDELERRIAFDASYAVGRGRFVKFIYFLPHSAVLSELEAVQVRDLAF